MSLYMFDTKFKIVTIWLAKDFNAPGIDWSNINLFENIDNIYNAHNYLIDIVQDHRSHVRLLVTYPTKGTNISDFFLTNDPSSYCSS